MEIQPEKEERTEVTTHNQIVAPQRESILTAVEIQPEKEDADGIKSLAVKTWFSRLLGSISVGVDRGTEDNIVRDSIQRLAAADPANVQLIAALQLELLAGYHDIALAQSRRIFFWALVGSGVGLIFLFAALAHAFQTEIAFLSGAIVEIIAGIVFVMARQSRSFMAFIAGWRIYNVTFWPTACARPLMEISEMRLGLP